MLERASALVYLKVIGSEVAWFHMHNNSTMRWTHSKDPNRQLILAEMFYAD